MDHVAAQATFVEITFAVNLLFAAYSTFRDYLRSQLEDKVREYAATTKTIETKPAELTRLNAINAKVGMYAQQFLDVQQIAVYIATTVSLIAAVCCVAVVFLDRLEELGHHTGWLFLPLPAYFLASGCNYGIFRLRGTRLVRRFRELINEFEPAPKVPQIPPELQP
jgi:hypothetical protein